VQRRQGRVQSEKAIELEDPIVSPGLAERELAPDIAIPVVMVRRRQGQAIDSAAQHDEHET
jgi:hypothetical protein